MQQQSIDPLEPQGLPIDPREAAMLLLGMTAGELKSIDEKVVSGRNSVGGIRSDINKIVSDIRGIVPNRPSPQPQPVPQPQPAPPVQQVQQTPQTISVTETKTEDNTDQLEFDFYKKLKPEDIEYQLRLIKSSLDNLDTKLNFIVETLKKKDLVVTDGNISQ